MDFNSFMNENKHFFYTYILKVFSNYSNVQQYDVDFLEKLHSIVKEKLPSKKTSPKKRKTPKKSLPKKRKESSSPVVQRLEIQGETGKFQKKLQDIPNNNYEMEYLSDNAFDPYDSD